PAVGLKTIPPVRSDVLAVDVHDDEAGEDEEQVDAGEAAAEQALGEARVPQPVGETVKVEGDHQESGDGPGRLDPGKLWTRRYTRWELEFLSGGGGGDHRPPGKSGAE